MTAADASTFVIAYLVVINLVVVLLATLDRILAPAEGIRVPERLLLTLSLLGGAAGAKLVQMVTRHKTLKYDYTAALSLIAIFQLALAAGFWTLVSVQEERVTLADLLSREAEEEEAAPPPKKIELDGQADEGWAPF